MTYFVCVRIISHYTQTNQLHWPPKALRLINCFQRTGHQCFYVPVHKEYNHDLVSLGSIQAKLIFRIKDRDIRWLSAFKNRLPSIRMRQFRHSYTLQPCQMVVQCSKLRHACRKLSTCWCSAVWTKNKTFARQHYMVSFVQFEVSGSSWESTV